MYKDCLICKSACWISEDETHDGFLKLWCSVHEKEVEYADCCEDYTK